MVVAMSSSSKEEGAGPGEVGGLDLPQKVLVYSSAGCQV